MYLKLGKSKINYYSNSSDFLILSQVVESNMSYEIPKLVTTTDELDLWFGTEDFQDRDYLKELLSSNVALYLYRPISNEDNTMTDGYIDYQHFPESIELYYLESDLPKVGVDNIKYRLVMPSGEYFDDQSGLDYDMFLWVDDMYVNLKDLPQNLSKESVSLSNRDVLDLAIPNDLKITASYPKFVYHGSTLPDYLEEIEVSSLEKFPPSEEKVERLEETLAFYLDFSKVTDFNESIFNEAPYFSITTKEGDKIIWFSSVKYPNEPRGIDSELVLVDKININTVNVSRSEIISQIKVELSKLGFKLKDDLGESWISYSSFKLNVNYLFTLKNFEIEPDIETTNNIIAKYLIDKVRLSFWSRSIGHIDTDLINVNIKSYSNNGLDYYKVIISRGNYSEVYEENIDSVYKLINMINASSKIVYCKDYSNYSNFALPEGDWNLNRGRPETYTSTDRWRALSELLNDEGMYPDYLMIPDITKYIDLSQDHYLDKYGTLVELASITNTQILIHNDKSTYSKNLTTDFDNRLVYFYESLQIRGNVRPGYYMFISGLLSDVYSMSTSNVIYYPPVINPYLSEDTELSNDLKTFKSNYLVSNNQLYYYREYFNGDKFHTSVWMRFCLGKIYRQLYKNQSKFISYKTEGEIRNSIERILAEIVTNYSIINNISITEFLLDLGKNKLDLKIDTEMSDLVDNNMSIDVTLNFNKPQ